MKTDTGEPQRPRQGLDDLPGGVGRPALFTRLGALLRLVDLTLGHEADCLVERLPCCSSGPHRSSNSLRSRRSLSFACRCLVRPVTASCRSVQNAV
jgi:hypothetical protein